LTAAALVFALAPTAFAGGGGPAGGDSCGRFQGSSRAFFLINENVSGATIAVSATFGPSGQDLDAIPRDFNNDGSDTFGVYSPLLGQFFLRNSNTPGAADVTVRFGAKDRQSPLNPLIGLSGDWNGNGSAGIGLYDPDASVFYLQNTPADGGTVDETIALGTGGVGLIPIVGDFNGDGTDTVGVYLPQSGQFVFKAVNTQLAAVTAIRFGGQATSNLPVVADFDGDGTDTVGLYSPSARTYTYGDANVDGGGTVNTFKFGSSDMTNQPVCGNWDGI
jgi:hypothetical protein